MDKAFSVEWNGLELVIKLDPNKDGKPVMELMIHGDQIPSEVISALAASKAKGA